MKDMRGSAYITRMSGTIGANLILIILIIIVTREFWS